LARASENVAPSRRVQQDHKERSDDMHATGGTLVPYFTLARRLDREHQKLQKRVTEWTAKQEEMTERDRHRIVVFNRIGTYPYLHCFFFSQ
jgi:hypothetical protein